MRSIYDSLAKSRKLEMLLKVWQLNMTEVFEKRIATARNGDAGPLPATLLAHHLSNTIITLLVWWIDHHCPIDPARMEDHFHGLIAGLR
jgi:hypothetical protein